MKKKLTCKFAENYVVDLNKMKATLKVYQGIDDSSVRIMLLIRNCIKIAILKREILLLGKVLFIGLTNWKFADIKVILKLVFQKTKRRMAR
jgi:hypothetical protein